VILVDVEDCHEFLKNFSEWDKIDLVIHQGAISATTEKSIQKLHEYNTLFSIELMKKAMQFGIPLKYASSASIYGNCYPNNNPLNQYALSKLQVDLWVLDNLDKFKLIQGFRYFNVYGEGEESKGEQASPISKFKMEATKFSEIKIFKGSENYRRDFIWVGDVVNIVINNSRPSGIFDLGTCNALSFKEIAILVSRKFGGKIVESKFPANLQGKYQFLTQSNDNWENYNFKQVNQFLELD
jgi:ADP-L-glycero-D-manno-heptose 6-epimerase